MILRSIGWRKLPATSPDRSTRRLSPGREAMDVRVVDEPTFRQRLQSAVGPYLEFVGVGSFVLILVLFVLITGRTWETGSSSSSASGRSTSRHGPWAR